MRIFINIWRIVNSVISMVCFFRLMFEDLTEKEILIVGFLYIGCLVDVIGSFIIEYINKQDDNIS